MEKQHTPKHLRVHTLEELEYVIPGLRICQYYRDEYGRGNRIRYGSLLDIWDTNGKRPVLAVVHWDLLPEDEESLVLYDSLSPVPPQNLLTV